MADDEHERGERVCRQQYADALADVRRIQDSLPPHCKTQEELHEAMRVALKKVADPAGAAEDAAWIDQAHARAQAELARRENERQQKIQKLKDAYWNFEKLPHSHEKINYQLALHSMLKRYGAKP